MMDEKRGTGSGNCQSPVKKTRILGKIHRVHFRALILSLRVKSKVEKKLTYLFYCIGNKNSNSIAKCFKKLSKGCLDQSRPNGWNSRSSGANPMDTPVPLYTFWKTPGLFFLGLMRSFSTFETRILGLYEIPY